MAIFSDITEKEGATESYPTLQRKIRLVQHCAAISTTAELLFFRCILLSKGQKNEV